MVAIHINPDSRLIEEKTIDLWGNKYLIAKKEVNVKNNGKKEKVFIKRVRDSKNATDKP